MCKMDRYNFVEELATSIYRVCLLFTLRMRQLVSTIGGKICIRLHDIILGNNVFLNKYG